MHATHTVHALPDLRVTGGRLGDGFWIGISVVVAIPRDGSAKTHERQLSKDEAESYDRASSAKRGGSFFNSRCIRAASSMRSSSDRSFAGI